MPPFLPSLAKPEPLGSRCDVRPVDGGAEAVADVDRDRRQLTSKETEHSRRVDKDTPVAHASVILSIAAVSG